ncbi:Cochaperone protein [Coemansia thaxteri]|uniref:Cochaperone protein n=1 Tax=Coemansia thaxteri TaxID=2663907 RepID=A0A9W8BHR1_9FUNG|nr:Cochaperone protein [Coemansia thaxteri]KAJ2007208.1 Cochaperone protein [Coemansia thaxteri]KAJ2467378.1 Cochaperone protein [Coemansia sp. RSA 2322]KAJ2484820.1 Cochaperone protein [Coemansia sp. RSA 2320]
MSKEAANKKTGDALYHQAVEAYADDEFEKAESLYTQAIAANNTDGMYYLRRSQVRLKLDNKTDAASDAQMAATLTENKSNMLRQYFKALLSHGTLASELGNYDEAAESLRKAYTINPSNQEVCDLLAKVEPLTTPKPEPAAPAADAAADAAENEAPAAPARPTARHEWYQNDEFVILEVFIKRVQKDAATIEFSDRGVSLSVKMATGSENNYEFEPLMHAIVPRESVYEILSTKIEIRMKKAAAGQKWDYLEETEAQRLAASQGTASLSSSRKGISWDTIAANAEKETKLKPGEQSVNELFQSIYKGADEETRRAMMKSYIESNGTALSTDWKSVSKGPVETSPPVDTYAKSYKR